MQKLMKGAFIRISILLLLVCAGAYSWESSRNAGLLKTTGEVVAHQYRDFTIRYSLSGQSHQFETRRGIFDVYGQLRHLNVGDSVAVLVNRERPSASLIDTWNGRYGMTLSFVFLTVILAIVAVVSALRNNSSD